MDHSLLSITEVGSVGANASIRSRTSGSDLRISEWGGIHRLIGLDCVDISANQWEGKCSRVFDYENDMIHFYCRDLRIEDVE